MQLIDEYLKHYEEQHGEPCSFLWQLKLSDNDYHNLKDTLASCAESKFKDNKKDACLYFAEWWRREYREGHAAKETVCCSLGLDDKYANDLYNAAKDGMRELGLQIIQGKKSMDNYSMFYQGGLPMNSIAADIRDTTGWHRFFKNLAWQGQDFSILSEKDRRVSLPLSRSIHAFCDTLQIAAESKQQELLPFHPNMEWWDVVIKDIEEGANEHKNRVPFMLKWDIVFDDISKKFSIAFNINGPQVLPFKFREVHNLEGRPFTSLSLLINETIEPFAEYDDRFFSRRKVSVRHKYHEGDVISLRINETGEVLWQRWLDLSDPKLIRLADTARNAFNICDSSEIIRGGCRILATSDWNCCVKPEGICPEPYRHNGADYHVFNFQSPAELISLTSEKNRNKNIHHDKPIVWTGIVNSHALITDVPVLEQIFNAPDHVEFIEGKDETESRADNIQYADKFGREWKEKPSYGVIRAKVGRGNESVDSIKFINTGQLEITCLSSSVDRCRLNIYWQHGTINSTEAEEIDGQWEIRKDMLTDKRYAPFIFNPRNGEPFVLHIIPPFNDFCIFDTEGKVIGNRSIIPLIDINSYRYYLNLACALKMYPGKVGADMKFTYISNPKLRNNSVSRSYFNDPVVSSSIPVEGNLSSLFLNGSRQIYDQLEQSTDSLPNTEAKLIVTYGNNDFTYIFKEYPYRLKLDNGIIDVKSVNRLPQYKDILHAIPFDDPASSPINLIPTEGKYDITDEIKNSDHGKWLVFGNPRGYVLPMMLDLDNEYLTKDERIALRESTLKDLTDELHNARCFSPVWQRALDWFSLLPLGQIPGSSILELVAISEDRKLLTKFAFQLALKTGADSDKMEMLMLSLLDFQSQMSINWQWAADISEELSGFLDDDCMQELKQLFQFYYLQWVTNEKKNDVSALVQYLGDIDGHIKECLDAFIREFQVWFTLLKGESDVKKEYQNPDINQYKDMAHEGVSSPGAQEAFKHIRSQFNITRGNELWITERREFNEILKRQNLSEYLDSINVDHNEDVRREIRKSILYGLKFKKDNEI